MNVKRIEPAEAKALLDSDEGYIYLDVRTTEEFDAGHVPASVNIPLMNRDPRAGMSPNQNFVGDVQAKFEPTQKLVIGCRSGQRSLHAASVLMAQGYENVVDMRGGFIGENDMAGNITFPGWTNCGLPTSQD